MSLLNLPVFGKSGFLITEDTFNTKAGLTNGVAGVDPQEIVIACKNKKRRVQGYLSEGIKISGQSEWKEMFGGGITALGGSILQTASNGMQMIAGTSIQQPWMNRKFWNSTKPFSFTFKMNFVAESDPLTEVYGPCNALLSFVFPRQLSDSELSAYSTGTSGAASVTQALKDALQPFAIPGPSLRYGSDSAKNSGTEGDVVSLVVGNMFAFGGVYLENVDIQYSKAMDKSGYPIAAEATIKATVMDVNYCNADGSFNINQYADGASAMAELLNSLNQLTTQLSKDAKALVEKAIGFFKGESSK